MAEIATIKIWNQIVGYVSWAKSQGYAVFEYDPKFLKSGLDICPVHMSLNDAKRGDGLFFFPELRNKTYLGLPGMLADALPDKFGNRIIDSWLAENGRDLKSFTPIERLCYIGKRGMGALEFFPGSHPARLSESIPVEINELVKLAQNIMDVRNTLNADFSATDNENKEAITDILRVGTSAGGARPKAVIAMNADGKIRSGQVRAPKGYDYWILKFDGVADEELRESKGYGRIEYAYYLMAKEARINITECRLLEENGRAHFMTKRFDRKDNKKIHMLSLCGMAHYDFNKAGEYGYEQAFAIMRSLKDIGMPDIKEQFRRSIFNVIARNQDDHTKNISFLMEPDGRWKLSPAYDVTYSYNPDGLWTNRHQMSLSGKRDGFVSQDLVQLGKIVGIRAPQSIIETIINTVQKWPIFAKEAGIKDDQIVKIASAHRMNIKRAGIKAS